MVFDIVFMDQFERNLRQFVRLRKMTVLDSFSWKMKFGPYLVTYFRDISQNFMNINCQFLTKIYKSSPFDHDSTGPGFKSFPTVYYRPVWTHYMRVM